MTATAQAACSDPPHPTFGARPSHRCRVLMTATAQAACSDPPHPTFGARPSHRVLMTARAARTGAGY
jgi:hypothetical protein